MNLREVIYDSLWAEYGAQGQYLWEELVQPSSVERAFSQSAVPTNENKRFALMRAAELEQRELLTNYLAAANRGTFSRGHALTMSDKAFTTFAGSLGDTMLDVAVVSTLDFRTGFLDPRLAIPAGAKAHIEGFQKLNIGALDRSNQSWFWYTVTGDFETAHTYMQAAVRGDSVPAWTGLVTTPNQPLTDKMNTLISSIGTDKNLDGGTKHRERNVIHPSEISTSPCDRKIAYGLSGEEELERESLRFKKLRRIFDLGHIYHDIVQKALSWSLPHFRAEVPAKNKNLRIFGSCDGVDQKEGMEIKTISLLGHSTLTKPKQEHIEQATIYAANLGLDAVSYIYVCKETAEITVYRIPVDRNVWHRIATRATRIIQAVDKKELPQRISGKDSYCKACKYSWICKPELVPPSVDRMFQR